MRSKESGYIQIIKVTPVSGDDSNDVEHPWNLAIYRVLSEEARGFIQILGEQFGPWKPRLIQNPKENENLPTNISW